MTIDEVKQIQAEHGLKEEHVVWIGEEWFSLAHTDTERSNKRPLEKCPIHMFLSELEVQPQPVGVYTVKLLDPDRMKFTAL